jgi:3-hydroxyisobutyrate dehydrogenase-like beta-hydroxyacid dehydrogenase
MIKKIGFIGLGQMGKWMALNLIKNDFDLIVHDIDDKAVIGLTNQGARPAPTPADLAQASDLIVLSLPNDDAVEAVLLGKNGVIHGSRKGQIVIDCGTSGYLWTQQISRSLSRHNIRFVDAPVTGMEQGAKDATLTIMVGAGEDLLAEIRSVLKAMGKEIVHMGDVGSGQLAKMINNIIYNSNLATLAEVLPMAVKLGLDPERIGQVINKGSGHSFASAAFIPNIIDGIFNKSYPMEHAYKDLLHAMQISAQMKIPLPAVHAAANTYQLALAMGLGQEDKGAMIKVFEQALGVKFRKNN